MTKTKSKPKPARRSKGAPGAAVPRRWRNALTVQVRELAAADGAGEPDGVQMTVRLGEGGLGAALLLASFEALRRTVAAEPSGAPFKARQTGGGAC
jgi:hypothetical protein